MTKELEPPPLYTTDTNGNFIVTPTGSRVVQFRQKYFISKISFLEKIALIFCKKRGSFEYETIGGVTYFLETDYKIFREKTYILDIRQTNK